MSSQRWTLSPSDFLSLWDDCRRCFYLHVARGFPRPERPSPSLATRLKASCDGRRTESIAPEMPAGVMHVAERAVESHALDVHLPDAIHRCVIRGTLDTLVKLDDGGWALVDIAADACLPEQIAARGRRLQACAHALEHPVEIPRDDGALYGFLAEVLSVLERPQPPGGAALCPWCVYRDASRRTGL